MRKLLVALGGLFLCLAANAQNVAIGSLTAQGADCTTAGACITLQFEGNDVNSASIQLSGTFTATVQFEASSDKGTTWVAISGTPLNSTTAATSATTANTWKFNVASLTNIRARASAWTSAPTVIIRSSKAVANAIGGGAVYASGLGTNNVIPKGNGAGQLADSSITDNGTTVTTTELIVPVLSSSATVVGGIGTATNGSGINFQATQLHFMQSGGRAAALQAAPGGFTMASNYCFSWSNTSNDALGTSADTALCKSAAGVVNLGSAAASTNTSGTLSLATVQYRGLAQTYFVTSDFTTSGSGTALELITGLSFTFPATTAINAKLDCYLNYNQNVAAVAVAFGFQDATVAPTNLGAWGRMGTNTTVFTAGTLAASTTTTATAVVSATPSAITTIWPAELHFFIEQPSNASTSVFSVRVSTATAADTVTIKRGSYCTLQQ